MSLNPAHDEVYSIQLYVLKLVWLATGQWVFSGNTPETVHQNVFIISFTELKFYTFEALDLVFVVQLFSPFYWCLLLQKLFLVLLTGYGWQATGKLYHLRLWVECTLFCNLQSRARTHAVLVIGLYELLGNSTI
jgi:hypothetical protein